MQRLGAITTGIVGLALSVACGLGGGSVAAPEPSAPPTVEVVKPAVKVSYGMPAGWQRQTEKAVTNGHDVTHTTLSGQAATVQLIFHPADAPAPDAEAERERFKAMLRGQIPEGLAFDEAVPHTRELAGASITGTIQGMTLRAPDAVIHGEHRSYLVRGERSTCLVVIDVPDVAHPTADAEVEEVLGRLQIP